MINKQGLWFLTLFSLILVLSIYYVTMPNEVYKSDKKDTVSVSKEEKELGIIETLKIELKEQREEEVSKLEEILNSDVEKEEKNKAYEKLKDLSSAEAEEENIETKIKNNYNLSSFIKLEDNTISVVLQSDKHDVKLANNIMRCVQEEYTEPKTISVKFS